MDSSKETISLDKKKLISNFMEITGGQFTLGKATQILVQNDFKLQQALQLYYEHVYDDDFFMRNPSDTNGADSDDDEVRPAFNIRETRILVEEEDSMKTINLRNVKKRLADNFRDFKTETEIQEGLANGEPLPKQSRMEDLYRPPIEITLHADFETAKKVASSEGKWMTILVNDENLASLAVYRDIFNNANYPVKETLRQHYVFLRKRFDDSDGAQILQNYRLTSDAIPVILIIDPRTGELKHQYKNKMKAKQFMQVLSRFKSEDKVLKEYPDIINISDSSDDESKDVGNLNVGCSSRTLTNTPPRTAPGENPKTFDIVNLDDSDDDFESPSSSSSENGSDSSDVVIKSPDNSPEINEVLDSEDEAEETEEEGDEEQKRTNIILRLEDGQSFKFTYNANKTVSSLISHIYNKYLSKTGIYNDKRKRMVLFSRVHRCCITTLNQTLNLEEAKLHPSVVIFHNTDSNA